MSIEAMKLALDALESTHVHPLNDAQQYQKEVDAMEALVKAIEQAEKKQPVAWMFQHEETNRMNYVSNDGMHTPEAFLGMNPRYKFVCALYITPPQRERIVFPTMLRRMWSGSEVQQWFDDNVNGDSDGN